MFENTLFIIVALTLTAVSAGCGKPEENPGPNAPEYWPTNGWRVSTPESQGMDSEQLAGGLDFLLKNKDAYNVHSLLIIRNGYMLMDAYFTPFTMNTRHSLASVTKSFLATLVGIAIDKGYIENVGQPVLNLFEGRNIANVDANKKKMTVENLLTMRSGLQCVIEPNEFTLSEMKKSSNFIQFSLDLPMQEEPGTNFVYCSPNVHLLSGMIREVYGKNSLAFAREHLFADLGISDVVWPEDAQQNSYGWGNMHATPHDVAKLGYLYLQNGRWEEQQILPVEWVTAATTAYSRAGSYGYGYLWWLKDDSYRARGRGGQGIYIIPDENMLIVFTAGLKKSSRKVWQQLLDAHIMPAIGSSAPLPANPEGVALLQSKIAKAAAETKAEPVPITALPPVAGEVSGKTFKLKDVAMVGVTSFTLTFREKDKAVFRINTNIPANASVEYQVGLDDGHRTATGRYGLPALAKGTWTSGNVFEMELDEVGNINRWRLTLTFSDDGEQVFFHTEESTGLGDATVEGFLADR